MHVGAVACVHDARAQFGLIARAFDDRSVRLAPAVGVRAGTEYGSRLARCWHDATSGDSDYVEAHLSASWISSSSPQLSGMGGAAGELNYETTQAWRLAIFFLFFLIISIVAEKARRRGPRCPPAPPRPYLHGASLWVAAYGSAE